MAVNNTRSMNGDLAEGLSDGTYKKIAMDRSKTPNDDSTWAARRDLAPIHYGFREQKTKVLGDGTLHVTPDYVENPDPGQFFYQ